MTLYDIQEEYRILVDIMNGKYGPIERLPSSIEHAEVDYTGPFDDDPVLRLWINMKYLDTVLFIIDPDTKQSELKALNVQDDRGEIIAGSITHAQLLSLANNKTTNRYEELKPEEVAKLINR